MTALRIAMVVAWAGAGTAIALRRRPERFGLLLVAGALVGALATVTDGVVQGVCVALLPAIGMHMLLVLPDGTCRTSRTVRTAGYAAAVVLGLVLGAQPDLPLWPVALEAAVFATVGLVGSHRRYRRAAGIERQRMQWFGWAVTVGAELALVAIALRLLTGWPPLGEALALATLPIPLALVLGSATTVTGRIDVLLAHTVSLTGLTAVVVATYLCVVLGLGRPPGDEERTVLGLSLVAAGVAALVWVPARTRLALVANRFVYGEKEAPEQVLRAFGSRLSRAIPLDELLLQAAQTLRRSLDLSTVEVWTGSGGRLERTVAVPDAPRSALTLSPQEESVVAREGLSGGTRVGVWLPQLLDGRTEAAMRVAPLSHSGRLLGLLVALRPTGEAFRPDEETVLVELAREMALALHNVQLDSALQASVEEVRRQAEELRASRARIVAAADAARRKIERDLHDGAQQHLVALAVSVRLARQVAQSDPAAAGELLDQVSRDLQEAVHELRSLAHGIYPPLLVERGLPDALSAAAGRAAIKTAVRAEDVGRYAPDIEAAVYFCCLEALQNAAKHAGEGAHGSVRVWEDEGGLLFEVADDGAGFVMNGAAPGGLPGAGFVNMADRLGAIGGSVSVESSPGNGTRVSGRIPLVR